MTGPFTQCLAHRKQEPFLLFFLFLFLLEEETVECHSQSNVEMEETRGHGMPDRETSHPALSETDRFPRRTF